MNYVCGFLFSEDHVLLLRKNKPDWQAGNLNGVGGKIEEGENKHEAMRREFLEEAGRLINTWTYKLRLHVTHRESIVYFFAAHCQAMFDVPACNEGELGWYKLTEFQDQKPIQSLKWLVPFCADPTIEQTSMIQWKGY